MTSESLAKADRLFYLQSKATSKLQRKLDFRICCSIRLRRQMQEHGEKLIVGYTVEGQKRICHEIQIRLR